MNAAQKLTAGLGLRAAFFALGMFVTGCSTSVILEPDNEASALLQRDLLRHRIERVRMKDGTEYVFAESPVYFGDAVTGEAQIRVPEGIMRKHVTLHLRDIAAVEVRKTDWTGTTVLVVLLAIVTTGAILAVLLDATI